MDGSVGGELVGVRKAATLLGVNPSTVTRQLQKFEADGKIATKLVAGEKLFDISRFRDLRGEILNPLMARQGGSALEMGLVEPPAGGLAVPPARPGLTTAATAHKAIQARLLQHDLDQKLGRVIERAAVTNLMQGAAREMRDALLALPARVKGELASMTDPAEIQATLDRHVREMLAALQTSFAQLAEPTSNIGEDAA